MRTNFTSHERRVLDCILRKTYGWNKKTDRISYSQFEAATGIDHRHIGRSLALLKRRQIITCTGYGYALEYGLQKDYDLWCEFTTIRGTAFDTKRGTDLPPSQAPIGTKIYHHPGDQLTPSQDNLPPSEAPNLTPSEAHTKARKHTTKALYKSKGEETRAFGELFNVNLTPEEYEKLVTRFGAQGATYWIDELSLAKASKGYKTKSDYATLLAWERRGKLLSQKGGDHGRIGIHKGHSRALPAREDYTEPEEFLRQRNLAAGQGSGIHG